MPELPELEAHAGRLRDGWAGHTLSGFRPFSFAVMKTVIPDPNEGVGRPLSTVGRRGKYLIANFDGVVFVVHLMQGGRLRATAPASGPKAPRGALARWGFDGADDWTLTEAGKERRVGVWVFDRRNGPSTAEAELFADLGPDADTLDA
ncbi:MAG: DNA-formamidopyrimidine glycosylase family protein, partial [Candidatus Microthrix subdominans]